MPPIGVVAVDADEIVRWFNKGAEQILDLGAGDVLNGPASKLDSRLADSLTRCARGEDRKEPVEWTDPLTKRSLSVLARRLANGDEGLGAVAIIRDLTHERLLRERQDQVERAAFWTELAAAISHEVRNPLVAISTFAQLLPERYADSEFRDKFSELVTHEVGRLSGLIDQIDAFANPRQLAFKPLSIGAVVKRALKMARSQVEENGCRIETSLARMPRIRGDEAALTECFAHLITNALEAVEEVKNPVLRITTGKEDMEDGKDAAAIRFADNGSGIPLQISGKIFSPFCTMKARGIGLGLPIVKRTVTDHDGNVSIETGDKGTCVTVTLPYAEDDSVKGCMKERRTREGNIGQD